jgi:hypothetical protein
MANRGGIAVYVTSHGFGHHNRVVSVINEIPREIPVTIRSAADLDRAWGERLTRPARLDAAVWDAGVVNPSGDSAATDGRASMERARAFHSHALGRVDAEADRLRAEGTVCVLCDIPPLPLVAARRAGIPGYLLANFTWSEIYAEYAARMGAAEARFVEEVGACYGAATAAFRAEPALPLREVERQIDVGLVVCRGRDRRAELRALLGLERNARVVYLYLGRYGQSDLPWGRLAEYDEVHFVGFHRPPGGMPGNVHVVRAEEWTGSDLLASSDAAFAKAGYGSTSEAMAAGTPMIYPPREGFAEHAALHGALRRWSGGVPISDAEFRALDLGRALKRAFGVSAGDAPLRVDGARRVAEHLVAAACAGGER